jgi:uncharacterized repeat protein (TIGR03806 family)
MLWITAGLFSALMGLAAFSHRPTGFVPRQRLSEYGFFATPLSALQPVPGVLPYAVNAPLFSDYAEKARFIALPAGERMVFREQGPFDFPVGSALIKNFFYYCDFRQPEKGRRIVETRLLVREERGWRALTYVWNPEQTDAWLEMAGAEVPVEWTTAEGKRRKLNYSVPNLNQCKGCHASAGQLVPIGVEARQLKRSGQLEQWAALGRLQVSSASALSAVEALTDYEDAAFPIDSRARAYLHANCAHCHHAQGSAANSGLFLEATQSHPTHLGIYKAPVAAGRGSGNRKYSIVPGKPQESILLYRMEADDPAIRMPELGRQLPHREGIELIRQWIRHLKAS